MGGTTPWQGVLFVVLLGIAFVGIAGTVFPMLYGEASSPVTAPRERPFTLISPAALACIVVVLGLYIPAGWDALLRRAAAALAG